MILDEKYTMTLDELYTPGAVGGSLEGNWVVPVAAGYSTLAAAYGPSSTLSGTLAAAKIMDGTYGTLAASSVLVAAGGTFDEAARNTDPGEANVVTPTAYKIQNVSKAGAYPTTATSQAAQKVTDGAFLTTNKDEMIADNASIRAEFGCDAGTAPTTSSIIVSRQQYRVNGIDVMDFNVKEA